MVYYVGDVKELQKKIGTGLKQGAAQGALPFVICDEGRGSGE